MTRPPTRWARHRARTALRRALHGFDVRLPSTHHGIAFTAHIKPRVFTAPPDHGTIDELAGAIRDHLREAAYDIAAECDPTDLATATDRCERHLASTRSLAADPPFEFAASLRRLELLHEDRAAVATLLTAQRRQAVADALRQQKTETLASQLADPAAVLAQWLERDGADWQQPPSREHLEDIAGRFAQYRPERERTPEHQLLAMLREFLASFPEPSQKRALYALLAAGMHRADRPQLAAKVETLLNGHASHTDSADSP
ncbi:hypothetical protein [Streptomyces chartreusis]|uniref:Uncharacterized protein n=1 Tax=Streptomyces chartreusis TaxID=1969 RepID=A0A7H8T4G0_STRCX|nr:hypothetical protein [Streptomyces chartreusis]QKZ18361.1 hypothetical protein HUT05_13915 [Streptomyces chartreusis]